MKILLKLIQRLYFIYAITIFCLVMLLAFPFIIISFTILGEKNGGAVAFLFLKIWALSFGLFGIFFKISGRENIKDLKAAIFVSNHSSFLDSPAISIGIPGQFRPLGKIEISKVPIFGAIYKRIVVLIDRSNPLSRAESIKKMSKLLSDGISVLIFPEGTMNRNQNGMNPFFSGAFKLSIETGAPIVPMVIKNSNKLLPPTDFLNLNPGIIEICFSKPLYPKQNADILQAEARKQMEKLLNL